MRNRDHLEIQAHVESRQSSNGVSLTMPQLEDILRQVKSQHPQVAEALRSLL